MRSSLHFTSWFVLLGEEGIVEQFVCELKFLVEVVLGALIGLIHFQEGVLELVQCVPILNITSTHDLGVSNGCSRGFPNRQYA